MKPIVTIKEIRTFVIKLSDDYDKVILSEDDARALHAALEHAIYPYGVFGRNTFTQSKTITASEYAHPGPVTYTTIT